MLNLNFTSLKVVHPYRESQLKVTEIIQSFKICVAKFVNVTNSRHILLVEISYTEVSIKTKIEYLLDIRALRVSSKAGSAELFLYKPWNPKGFFPI